MNLNQMVVDYVNKIGYEEASRVFNRDKQTIVMWLKTGSIPLSAAQVVLNQGDEVSGPMKTDAVPGPKLDGGLFFPPKKEVGEYVPDQLPLEEKPKVEVAPPLAPLTPLGVWQDAVDARLDKLETFARRMTDPDRIRPSLAQPPTEAIAKTTIPHPLMEPVIEGGNPARGDEEVVELPNANRDWNMPYRDYNENGRRQVGR